ncbi:O-antigen ligase family protein [Vreelandella profundi]|uniref:O-antigen ligase family protein n=1 Tax=Vreelandella profundi TaxID=2852117 RepID=UPI001EF0094D|nr:O-antigen ligase family protein [Halomonas profundi]
MLSSNLSSHETTFSKLSWFTNVAVFLFGAIALVIPSGYSVGAALLLLGGLGLLFTMRVPRLSKEDVWIVGAVLAYVLVAFAEVWWDGQGSRGLDKPSRFILAIPALWWVLRYPPNMAFLWSGMAVGAIAAGSWAGWQKLFEGVDRAQGYTYVIQFGNLSMLLGVMCLAGLGWAIMQRYRHAWICLLLLGALAGILGSLFSGSRGGWVGFPIVLLVLYRAYGRNLSNKLKTAVVAAVIVGAIVVYAVPQVGVQGRVHEAFNDVSLYVSGENRTTSVGARFEMWRGAANLIQEKPLLGWGYNGYKNEMLALSDQGFISREIGEYGHAHNEFIDAFAKRGLLGLAVLIGLYLIPLRLFSKGLSAENLSDRALATAGVLLPVTYIDFGLSQVFLTHNSGVMMYAFLLAILWGIHSGRLRRLALKGNHP